MSEIDIPDGVEELCDECFSGCEGLSRVTFSESSSLKRIGKELFRDTGLNCLSLSAGVVSIDLLAFSKCPLRSLFVSDVNLSFAAFDSLSLSRDGHYCYQCNLVMLSFPTVLKSFFSRAFQGVRVFRVSHLVCLLG